MRDKRDILERLQDMDTNRERFVVLGVMGMVPLLREAAEEIERLRALPLDARTPFERLCDEARRDGAHCPECGELLGSWCTADGYQLFACDGDEGGCGWRISTWLVRKCCAGR